MDERVEQQVEQLMAAVRSKPELVAALEGRDAALAEAVRSGNKAEIKKILELRLKARQEERERLDRAMRNPLSVEAQELMLKQARQNNVDRTLQHAQEYIPESFGSVVMLYVMLQVNSKDIVAFVDSGAQSTIMSMRCAEKCGLTHVIDDRFQGIAQGVGTSKILGRVHVAQIKMGSKFFEASLTILEDDKVDFLFGLDLLKRYQCCIDLGKDVLRIQDEALPFLSEGEVKAQLDGHMPFGARALPPAGTPTNAQPAASAGAAASGGDTPKAEDVVRLMELGFSDEEARNAIRASGGNVDAAAALLLRSFSSG